MFGIQKSELLISLRMMQNKVCAYGTDIVNKRHACDCKYDPKDFPHMGDENNGCPELSMLYKMLSVMTDEQFEDLCQRAGIVLSSWRRPTTDGEPKIEATVDTAG